jgi:hypothetical protein
MPGQLPSAPSNLSAFATVSSVSLSWIDSDFEEYYYIVKRNLSDPSQWFTPGPTAQNTTSLLDTNHTEPNGRNSLEPGSTYQYTIQAINCAGMTEAEISVQIPAQ